MNTNQINHSDFEDGTFYDIEESFQKYHTKYTYLETLISTQYHQDPYWTTGDPTITEEQYLETMLFENMCSVPWLKELLKDIEDVEKLNLTNVELDDLLVNKMGADYMVPKNEIHDWLRKIKGILIKKIKERE